jgi:hypothetical protein
MFRPDSLGAVIAEREFELLDVVGGAPRVVRLQLGTPSHFPDSDENYYCPFLIDGLDQRSTIRYAAGVDSMQAITGALMNAATMLYTSKAFKEDRLRFLGSADLGLPVVGPIAEMLRDRQR